MAIRLSARDTVGIHAGITEQGAQRLEVAGEIQIFNAGEVSLRPAERAPP